MDDLYSTCEHPFLYYDEDDGSAYCTECDDHQGTYCERSPDCVCHTEGQVESIDPDTLIVHLRDDSMYEVELPPLDEQDSDRCLFCGKTDQD